MKLHELKSGMVVEFRNGVRGLVVNDVILLQNGHDYANMCNILDNSKHKITSSRDIVKVYKSEAIYLDGIFNNDTLLKIWDRNDVIKGDTVRVINSGKSYTTNVGWFKNHKHILDYDIAIRYVFGETPHRGNVGEVILRDGNKVVFERTDRRVYLMDIEGLEKVED